MFFDIPWKFTAENNEKLGTFFAIVGNVSVWRILSRSSGVAALRSLSSTASISGSFTPQISAALEYQFGRSTRSGSGDPVIHPTSHI